jgi:hypothetical protein
VVVDEVLVVAVVEAAGAVLVGAGVVGAPVVVTGEAWA